MLRRNFLDIYVEGCNSFVIKIPCQVLRFLTFWGLVIKTTPLHLGSTSVWNGWSHGSIWGKTEDYLENKIKRRPSSIWIKYLSFSRFPDLRINKIFLFENHENLVLTNLRLIFSWKNNIDNLKSFVDFYLPPVRNCGEMRVLPQTRSWFQVKKFFKVGESGKPQSIILTKLGGIFKRKI